MKNKILELGKKYVLKLHVECTRVEFDIIDYDVYHGTDITGEFIGAYRHLTGKTNTGIVYTTDSILPDVENDIIEYKLKFKK